jgi:hypothetical protein
MIEFTTLDAKPVVLKKLWDDGLSDVKNVTRK